MRTSVDPDDPGYANYIANRPVRVFLDGIERDGVFTADEEKRFIIMAVRDERGNLKIKDDMVVREKWTGNVHIEVAPAQDTSVKIHINFDAQKVPGRVIAQATQRAIRRGP